MIANKELPIPSATPGMECLSWCVYIWFLGVSNVKLVWIHSKNKTILIKKAEAFLKFPSSLSVINLIERKEASEHEPPKRKKGSEQRGFIIIIYSWWSFFLILIPSTDLWKAELTDRMTEQTQNSWNGDFPSSTIASVIENCFFLLFFLNCHPSDRDSRCPAYSTCRDRGWRRLSCPSVNRAGFINSRRPLQSFGGQSLSISPGSSLRLAIVSKKEKKTTYTGTHVKMRESNYPTKENADVLIKSSMSSNT